MFSLIVRRVLQTVVVLLIMSALVFAGLYLIGDPVEILASPEATPADREAIRQTLGLNLPLWQQYGIFLAKAVHLDFGKSFLTGEPAMWLILQRLPATLELSVIAIIAALLLSVPFGLYAGLKPRNWISRSVMGGSILGFSLPNFWIELMSILVFSVYLGWLPAGGRGATVAVGGVGLSFLTLDGLRHIVLPAAGLAIPTAALLVRVTRAAARETWLLDYIKFARAKGLSRGRLIGVHLLKNILVPITTIGGLEFGQIFAFAVVTETIFTWPGMGKLLIDSILQLDRPVVVAYLMLAVVFLALINLLVDISYAILDPRVRTRAAA